MKKRILIIEDEREIALIMKMRLEASGYEVLQAFDGEEGMRKAKGELPDLILLDLVLPKLGGADILAEFKESERCKRIPVVIVSGLSQDTAGVRACIDQADAYFLKPFDYIELLATVKDCLKDES